LVVVVALVLVVAGFMVGGYFYMAQRVGFIPNRPSPTPLSPIATKVPLTPRPTPVSSPTPAPITDAGGLDLVAYELDDIDLVQFDAELEQASLDASF